MVRTIVQLTEEQSRKLKERAKKQGISVSELVRQGVDRVLAIPLPSEEARRRAREAVGFIHDVPDLAVNHDKYLAEAYLKDHSA